MMDERISQERMKQLCPGLTAKTELVLVRNPATDDEAVYVRDGGDWLRLGGNAAPEDSFPRRDAPDWRKVPRGEGYAERDEDSGCRAGPAASIPDIDGLNPQDGERCDES